MCADLTCPAICLVLSRDIIIIMRGHGEKAAVMVGGTEVDISRTTDSGDGECVAVAIMN